MWYVGIPASPRRTLVVLTRLHAPLVSYGRAIRIVMYALVPDHTAKLL